MNVFKVIGAVLTSPTGFFAKIGKGKDNLGFAFGYYALLLLVGTIIGLFMNLLLVNLIPIYGQIVAGSAVSLVGSTIFSYILSLAFGFAFAGLLHVWILIFGGENSYVKTYELGAYAGTPSMLFGFIPILGWCGSIWSLILLIIGTQQVHNIERTKAILMYVVPFGILFLLTIIGAIIALMVFGSLLPIFTSHLNGGLL